MIKSCSWHRTVRHPFQRIASAYQDKFHRFLSFINLLYTGKYPGAFNVILAENFSSEPMGSEYNTRNFPQGHSSFPSSLLSKTWKIWLQHNMTCKIRLDLPDQGHEQESIRFVGEEWHSHQRRRVWRAWQWQVWKGTIVQFTEV